jgi:hypothetical protein
VLEKEGAHKNTLMAATCLNLKKSKRILVKSEAKEALAYLTGAFTEPLIRF